jgi:hypothetical protein
VNHTVSGHISHTVHVIHVAIGTDAAAGAALLSVRILLDVRLRVRKVAHALGVAAPDRALLKVTLEDVTARKRITAENAHVRAVAGI